MKPKVKKPTVIDMELTLARYFNPRVNLIVPNISWGAYLHECDLLLITKNNYAYEIEIKTSLADLIKDKTKRHGHNNKKIKYLYFAIPEHLEGEIQHIPERAGIIVVFWHEHYHHWCSRKIRSAKPVGDYKFSAEEKYNIARLGSMRIWDLKSALHKARNEI